MAQTNIMVTYVPARQSAPSVGVRRNAVRGQRRWSVTLAGTLLAGGAVFVLGQFVTADGNLRETSFPMRAGKPIAGVQRAGAIPAAPATPRPQAEPTPLPYLALVRDIAPRPATSPAARPMSSPAVRTEPRVLAPEPEVLPEDKSALAADLAAPTLPPPPASGLRRDLEGFLQTQGYELAGPDPSGTLLALEGELPPAPIVQLAVVQAGPPVANGLVEPLDATPVSLPAAPARVGAPLPLAEVEPPPAASPVATLPQPAPAAVPARFRAESAPLPAKATAPSAHAQMQSYPLAVVNGEPVGAITLRDGGAGEPAIHLGALVGLLRLRMPDAEFTRLSGAAAADRFVTLDELRVAGITVQFDARENRLLIDAR